MLSVDVFSSQFLLTTACLFLFFHFAIGPLASGMKEAMRAQPPSCPYPRYLRRMDVLKTPNIILDEDPNEKGWLYDVMVEPGLHRAVRHDDLTKEQIARDKKLREEKRTMPRSLWMQLTKGNPEPTKRLVAEESQQTYDSLAEHTTWDTGKSKN